MPNWFISPTANPAAAVRLFCFPYGGGSPAIFWPWAEPLKPWAEIFVPQLPGRGSRIREASIGDISQLVEALLPALVPLLDRPCAFFGHSFGALLAYELARTEEVQRAGLFHLIVSAVRGPGLAPPRPLLHPMADEDFVREVRGRYDGIPETVLRDPELMALLLPALRADLRAYETYRHNPEPRLTVPVTALAGERDRIVPPSSMEGWSETTAASFTMRVFPGGHLFLQSSRASVLQAVETILSPLGVR